MKLRATVQGAQPIQRALDGLARDVDDFDDTVEAIADVGEQIATQRSVRRTGRLAAGNRARRDGRNAAVIENAVPYSGYVDRGTAVMDAQPFSQPTADALEPLAVARVTADINRSINRRGLS